LTCLALKAWLLAADVQAFVGHRVALRPDYPSAGLSCSGQDAGSGRRPFKDFEPGEAVEGVVKSWVGTTGYTVDIGARRGAYLEACEMCDGFPSTLLEKGDKVTARILDVTSAPDRIYITRRSGDLDRPERVPPPEDPDVQPFGEAGASDWFEGVVNQMVFFGVYVRVDPPGGSGPVEGLLHKSKFLGSFADEAFRGMRVAVRVERVEKAGVYFTMLPP